MTQANEGFLNHVVAEGSAEQECQKIDRGLRKKARPGGLPAKLMPRKSCCHRYRL